MNIVVDYWRIQWRSVRFNVHTGSGKVRWFSKKPGICRGWATKHKGNWFAVWNGPTGLIFQAGEKRWNIRSFDCAYKLEGSKGIFEIQKSGITEYLLEYKVGRDPILDFIDLEEEDFFFWVHNLWNDPSRISALESSWEVVET